MKYPVILVFALAVAGSLLTDCDADPQIRMSSLPNIYPLQPILYPNQLPQLSGLVPPQIIISPPNVLPQRPYGCSHNFNLDAPHTWGPSISSYIGQVNGKIQKFSEIDNVSILRSTNFFACCFRLFLEALQCQLTPFGHKYQLVQIRAWALLLNSYLN